MSENDHQSNTNSNSSSSSKEDASKESLLSTLCSAWSLAVGAVSSAYHFYYHVDIKGGVSKAREAINEQILSNKYLKAATQLPIKPKELQQQIESRMKQVSKEFDRHYPYAASLCRTHPTLIIGTFTVFVGFPLWGFAMSRRLFVGSLIGAAVTGKSLIDVANFAFKEDAKDEKTRK